jgi:putative transposase
MTIRRELIDELLKDYETPQDILGEGGLLKELTKAVVERCLETELDTHLGYPKHGRKGNATGNMRNGHSQKTLKGEQGHVDIEVPRDRQATFEPQLVKKGQTRLEGFDDKIDLLSWDRSGSRIQFGTEGSRNGMYSIRASANPGEHIGRV